MEKRFFLIPILLVSVILFGGACIQLNTTGGEDLSSSSSQDASDTSRWFTFTHGTVFTMNYPPDFPIDMGDGLDGGNMKVSITKISFPENSFNDEATNFNGAYLIASESDDLDDLSACTSFSDLPNSTPSTIPTKNINGVVFTAQETTTAASGNIYSSKIYRTLRKEYCYELKLTIHTGNIGNYPQGTVKEFDKNKAFSILEKIAETLTFTDS